MNELISTILTLFFGCLAIIAFAIAWEIIKIPTSVWEGNRQKLKNGGHINRIFGEQE